jgi:type IV secretory pathway TrbL component
MQKITSAKELKDAIRFLEEKQTEQGWDLKEQFFIVIESIKPVNIIKNTFNELASSPNLISNILSTSIGLTVGYISNKTIAGSSGNLFRKFLGTILQFGVTALIIKNPEAIKSFGNSLLHRFLSKKEADS